MLLRISSLKGITSASRSAALLLLLLLLLPLLLLCRRHRLRLLSYLFPRSSPSSPLRESSAVWNTGDTRRESQEFSPTRMRTMITITINYSSSFHVTRGSVCVTVTGVLPVRASTLISSDRPRRRPGCEGGKRRRKAGSAVAGDKLAANS